MAPVGISAATWLLCWSETGEWRCWLELDKAASLVDLAVVLYSLVAVIVERCVIMIWWALEERRKRLEKLRAETLAEGRAEGRAVGLAEGRTEGRAAGLAEGRTEGRAVGLAEGQAEGRNQERRELAVKLAGMSEDDRMAEINRLIEEAQQTVNGGAPRG